jgi:transposase
MTLIAHLPELGQVDRRAIASLGGLAPRAHDTGRHRGKRFLGEGRRHVRRTLYMASMSALRHPGFLADFVVKTKAAGKPGKVILMAVARRLLTIANAILRSGVPFQAMAPEA